MDLSWQRKHFHELSVQELHDLLQLRVDVFVVEQNCAYREIDGKDPSCMHILAKHGYTMVAYARIIPASDNDLPHIGRVVVHEQFRRKGIARDLMTYTLKVLEEITGSRRSALAAQAHLEDFYSSFGYKKVGEEYMWDGIPHVDMELAG
jgi:ElaA protein